MASATRSPVSMAAVLVTLAVLWTLPACRSQRVPPGAGSAVLLTGLPGLDIATRRAGVAAGIRFQHATAMTGTAAGMLYVADGAENSIRVFRLEGGAEVRDVMRIGTSGSGAAEFNGVWDVDVFSGLFVVAADRGNGRIQRFDRDGALVELFPLNPGESAPSPVFVQNAARGVTGWSEPIALATAPNDDLFMVDARSSGLYRTDRRRERLEQMGADVLTEPIDVVVAGGRLLVLDAAEGIVVFDVLGTHIRTIRVGGLERLAVLSDGRLLGIAPTFVVLFDEGLAPASRLFFRVDAPVRDVFHRGDLLYLLTDTALYVAAVAGVFTG